MYHVGETFDPANPPPDAKLVRLVETGSDGFDFGLLPWKGPKSPGTIVFASQYLSNGVGSIDVQWGEAGKPGTIRAVYSVGEGN